MDQIIVKNKTILLLLLTTFAVTLLELCAAEESVGAIYPPGSTIARVGDDINITCSINLNYKSNKGKNSSNLWFYGEDKRGIPKENIAILNETTIVFMIKNATEMSEKFSCLIDKNVGIDIFRVIVGTEPKPVSDFNCLAYDFEYFICNFTASNNSVPTTYNLSYKILSQAYVCPLMQHLNEYFCNMSLDNNLYRQVYECYNFTLFSNNSFGNLSQSFMINHYDSVIPAKPDLKRVNTTTNSVTFEWKIPKYGQYAEKGLKYEAMILALNDRKKWRKIDENEMKVTNVSNKSNQPTKFRTEFTDLEYSYWWYDIRVHMRVATSKNDGTMWSDMFNTTFRTNPKRPDDPPTTDVGSFHIDPNGNVHLYWETLPQYKENGPNIQYVVTEAKQNGQLINLKPIELSLTSAKFKLFQANYEFEIRSNNSMGLSEKGSIIRIPREEYPKPQWLRKIYHQQKYTLSWTAPNNVEGLIDYTVFWCASKTESSNQCKDSIHFKHYGKEVTNITHEEEGNSTMNFAVSANYESASSGMVWAMCTALKTSDFGKIKPIVSLSDSTTCKIQWSLECVYSSILEGYNLVYCPVSDLSDIDPECNGPQKNVTISKNAKEYAVHDLTPYTTYKFAMLMFSTEKQGPLGDPVLISTLETASTPPRRLQYKNVTSNSVTLTWKPPEHFNGKLRYYEVIYNGEKIRVEDDKLLSSNVSEIVYTLGSLRSFHDYKIYVIAHTVHDSEPSNDIHFKTKVGIPGSIDKFDCSYDNPEVTFKWKAPDVPSGRLEFYEFKSIYVKDNQNRIELISTVNGTNCHLRLPSCTDSSHSFQFEVRAINAVYEDEMDLHTFSKRDIEDVEKYTAEFETILHDPIVHHESGNILKRHSHAEIDDLHSESSNNNHHQIIYSETTTRIRHNRQEREKDMYNREFANRQMQHNGESLQHHKPIDYLDETYAFKCQEDNDLKLKRWIEKHSEQKGRFYKGEWKKLQSFVCNYKSDLKRKITLVCGILIAVFVIMIFFFFGWRKYSIMKNIVVVFPPGLADINQPNHKGENGMLKSKEIAHSTESLSKIENHHLLASIGNDSGYLQGIDGSEKSDIGYDLSDPIREDEHSGHSDSVEMSELSDSGSNPSSASESPNVNLREMKTPETSASMMSPLIINGYVQQQSFSKPLEMDFNGYTTLDAFGKPIIPATTNLSPLSPTNNANITNGIPLSTTEGNTELDTKHKELNPNNGINENICGYVTHKQLSQFGHRLQ